MSIGHRNRSDLLISTALQTTVVVVLSLPAAAQPAPNARPTGGSVVGGAAAISQTGSNTRIEQSSQRAAIDWKSFNVGSQQSVTFSQPSANAVALNRVTGPDPSQIAGRIDANGQIILVNQSGVNFYKGAQVNAAGVMVSAAGISNQNFMAGVMKFDQPGDPNARIDNQGSITVKQAGLAALVAPRVANSGTITARLGHVVLAGAKTATLDLYGDGLLSLDVSDQVTQAPVGKDGRTAIALVTNSGLVVADGGTVQLTARAADGIVQNLVQARGQIRAATMGDHTGTVALNGVGGSIVVEGQLSAPGKAPGTKGGNIEVVSNGNVVVASAAKIDASGRAGGGVVAIGTTLDRARNGSSVTPTRVATNVKIAQGAQIASNATARGDGGRITVLSSKITQMDGAIAAKGAPSGGNGGFVEVSGNVVAINGTADESAAAGKVGTLLLDPTNLNIVTTSPIGTNIDGEFSGNTLLSTAPDARLPSTITTGKLAALAAGGDINVQATGTIDVQNSVAVANGLLLQAEGNLSVDRGVTLQSKAHTLELDAGFDFPNSKVDLPGTINLGTTGTGAAPQLQAVNLTLRAGSSINLNDAVITVANVADINALAGNVTQAAGGLLAAATLTGNVVGTAALVATNAISNLGNFTAAADFTLSNAPPLSVTGTLNAGGFLSITNAGPLGIGGSVSAGFVSLSASSVSISGPVATTGELLMTASNGAIVEAPTGSITANLIAASTLGTGGDISLPNKTNLIAQSDGNTATDGNVVLVSGENLTLTGTHSGNNLFFEVAAGGGTLTLSDNDPRSDGANPAILTATRRISLVADNDAVEHPLSAFVDSTITAPTVELAPYSTTSNTSLLAGSGLLINATMLSIIQTNGGTLEVGGFTNLPAGAITPAASTTAIDIGAPLDLTAIASTLRLDANGPVSQSGGPLTVTALTGSGGAWTLNNAANAVGSLGNVTAVSFSLLDSSNVTVAGTLSAMTTASITDPLTVTVAGLINAGGVGLGARDIDISGSVDAGTIALNANGGAINATGVLVADELTGSATTAASLTGANRIAALGAFTVGTSFMLNDSVDLLIASALNGPRIAIRDPANRISVADGAVITTGGSARPAGPIQSALEPSSGAPGALFQAASFTQIGSSFVVGQVGGPATLQISITGNAQFDPPLGLQGPCAWLILNLTNGTATGNVFVNALDVSYTTPGSTNLTGTIAGIGGGPAAAIGNIEPAINANYLFNGCIIAAALCHPPAPPTSTPTPTPIPRVAVDLNTGLTATLGAIYPLLSLAPAAVTGLPKLSLIALPMLTPRPPQLTDPDVVPPNITFLDY
jgi:filamentous hemagglutinin family protein